MAREVLDVDEADWFLVSVHDDQVINTVIAQGADDFDGEVVLQDRDGVGGHVLGDGAVADFAICLISSDEVAVGENPGE